MGFDQVRQRRLSDDIVEQLEGMILEGTLKSGERLPAERALAEFKNVRRRMELRGTVADTQARPRV